MSLPDPPDVKALARTVAALRDQLGDLRGQVRALKRRDWQAGGEAVTGLVARFEVLGAQVRDALDAAAPRGPAAPRWDNLDQVGRARQLAALRDWVTKILIPGWVHGGSYELADCWDRHEQALWELGAVAARWRQAYGRDRPDLALALEWQDRWLPGAMRRIAEATRDCKMGHQARRGLSFKHAADRAQRENPGRGGPDPRGLADDAHAGVLIIQQNGGRAAGSAGELEELLIAVTSLSVRVLLSANGWDVDRALAVIEQWTDQYAKHPATQPEGPGA